MKKIFLTIITTLVLTFGSFGQIDPNTIGSRIAKDSEFIQVLQNLEDFSVLNKNRGQIKALVKKDKLTEEEREQLASALGFRSVEDIYHFEKTNGINIENIINRYALSKLSESQLSLVFEIAVEEGLAELNSGLPVATSSCERRYKSCKKGAYSLYTVEMAGCVGAGFALGGVSFWCGGCIGAAVGTFCATAATLHLDSMLESCQFDYEDCLK